MRSSFRHKFMQRARACRRTACGAMRAILLAAALAGCNLPLGSAPIAQTSASGPPPGSFVVHMNGQAGAAAVIR